MSDVIERKCPNCGAPLPARAPGQTTLVCGFCQVELEVVAPPRAPSPPYTILPSSPRDAPWTCAECGRENQAHYRFCLGCGAEPR